MTDVVSVKFKNRGKCYFFSPNGLSVQLGDMVVVETSKGLELADCCRGNHFVPDEAVVQPLRPVVRVATADDLRVAELNKQREKDAFDICQRKIAEHGLDMKLVDVECNFEGSKTMFFFTSDGRVDFRELVKDLAGIFRNRIELRQIGVRDEAKMLGGIGICGRPYCCSQFLDDFQPVSTKMAKVQSLSLNPTKISGSCGRLMCCLRYEQDAYEELVKRVPKAGAFVETKDGYGTAVSVNLLRQTVLVRLDRDTDDSLHLFKANELCAVPGGRPRDGEAPVSVLRYVPEPEESEEEPEEIPSFFRGERPIVPAVTDGSAAQERPRGSRGRQQRKPAAEKQAAEKQPAEAKKGEQGEAKRRRNNRGRGGVKTVKVEAKAQTAAPAQKQGQAQPAPQRQNQNPAQPAPQKQNQNPAADPAAKKTEAGRSSRRRRYNRGKPKTETQG